jgi:ankyrin repeat protein
MRMNTKALIVISIGGLFVATLCFSGGMSDSDKDDLFNACEEQIFGTSPTISDTDADGILDGDEDHDGDGLTNLEEQNNIEGLHHAISNGDIEGVIRLIDYYPYTATVDARHRTALAIASESGNSEIVRILLQAGADVNEKDIDGFTALVVAIRLHQAEVVKALIEAGADATARDIYGETPLIEAAMSGNMEIVTIFLDAGADVNAVNAQNDDGSTPLMRAAQGGNIDGVKLLLQLGAEVDARDDDGNTALLQIITHLRDVVSSEELQDFKGRSQLYSYVQRLSALFKELVANGADVNTTNNNGETALIIAAQAYGVSLTAVVETLLEAGVDVSARDNDGKTALMYARFRHHAIEHLLIDAGAEE